MDVVGLGLVLIGASVVFDPFGIAGYLALKVLAVALGLALLWASLAWDRSLAIPCGRAMSAGAVAFVLMTAATVSSPAVERSLLGAPQRLSGLLMWLSLAVAFISGFSLRRLRGESVDVVVMRLSVAAVVIVGGFAVLEALGVGWNAGTLEFRGRLRSTLGNPSVLASLVLLMGPLCVVAVVSPGRWRWRWSALCACGLAAVMLIGSQTRGAVAASAMTAVVLVVVRASWRQRLWLLGGTGLLLASTIVVGRWGDLGFGFRGRVAIWDVTVRAIADRLLLGVGPEMFIVEYSERVGDSVVREFGRHSTTDKAHSGLLDFAVSFGVPAALLYTAVLAAVGFCAVRAMASDQIIRAALGAGVLAYVLQQQVFIHHPALDGSFWMLTGVLVASVDMRARFVRPMSLASLTAVCVIAGLVLNSWSVMRNDHDFMRAHTAKTFAEAYEHLESAADRRVFDDTPYILMGELLQRTPHVHLVARGARRLRRGAALNPGNEPVALALADVHLQGFRLTASASWAQSARSGLDDLIDSQPTNGLAFLKRGMAAFYLGDHQAAGSDWRRALWLIPGDERPANNLLLLNEQ